MRTGLDRILEQGATDYGRTGWLVTGAAVTTAGFVWAPAAAAANGFTVTQLFAPEHGAHGAVREGQPIDDHRDPWTGLPVHSLYRTNPALAGEALSRCDTVIIDMPDLATRYGTYLATSADLIDAVAVHPNPPRVIVADRPNVLGRKQEGPPLLPGFESYVGRLNVPIRHGLTLGEALRAYVREAGHNVELEVVTVEGWDSSQMIDQGPFLPRSPNLSSFPAQLLYVGTCLFEGTNVSEGRGTASPFEMIGAPWLDAQLLAAELRKDDWPGVAIRAVSFVPGSGKHQGQLCEGVFIHVCDASQVRPLELTVRLLELVFSSSDETELREARADAGPRRSLDRLWGSAGLADYLSDRGTGGFTIPATTAPDMEAVALYPY
jgi:uncharacterized protein YbbC (DUF1343 family)